jgi:hypothetical protein
MRILLLEEAIGQRWMEESSMRTQCGIVERPATGHQPSTSHAFGYINHVIEIDKCVSGHEGERELLIVEL